MNKRENFYILLELNTNPPETNKEVISKAIKKKQGEWSRLRNHPSKGRVAQLNLGLLKKIKEVMLDEQKREKEASSLIRDIKEKNKDREEELSKMIEMLSGKKKIFESEYKNLIEMFRDFNSSFIKALIHVPIVKDGSDKIKNKIKVKLDLETLSSLKLKKIETNLNLLKKKDLYHFLNTTIDKSYSEIQKIVKIKYIENNKVAAKTALVTAKSELLGISTGIFESQKNKTLYDNSLIVKKLDLILPFIDISAINGKIEPEEYLYIIYEGNELHLSEDIIKKYLQKYCKLKNCSLIMPTEKDLLFRKKSPNDMAQELYKMVKNRETREVEKLLEKGVKPNYRNEMGDTPVIMATYQGDLKIVKLLIEFGANVDSIGHNRMTSLIWAAAKEHLTLLRFLLSKTELINHQDKFGFTALMWAASYGFKDIVKLLLEYNADTELKNKEGHKAQDLARKSGFLPLFYIINDNKKADKMKVKIFEAIENNDLLYVQSLSKRDFLTENEKGEYPLNVAIRLGQRDIIDWAISRRMVDFNKKNSSGSTFLIDAIKKKDLITITKLFDKGAKINIVDEEGYSPLMHAVTVADKSIIQYLIDKKADIEHKDKRGNRALTLAVWQQKLDIITLLVDRGADVMIFNNSNKDLLSLAKEKGDNYIISYLESIIEIKYPSKPKSSKKIENKPIKKEKSSKDNRKDSIKPEKKEKREKELTKDEKIKKIKEETSNNQKGKKDTSTTLRNHKKNGKEKKEGGKPWWKFW